VQTTTTTTKTLRKTTNTLTIDNSDCLVLFKEGHFYTSNGFENKTLSQGEHQEPKPQQKNKNKKKNKEPENWNNMAYLMVTMQAFFLFLCFLLLEEYSCNDANVAAKMLDDANSQRKKKKHAQRNSGESLLLLRFVR
jgi:hypothetical protein